MEINERRTFQAKRRDLQSLSAGVHVPNFRTSRKLVCMEWGGRPVGYLLKKRELSVQQLASPINLVSGECLPDCVRGSVRDCGYQVGLWACLWELIRLTDVRRHNLIQCQWHHSLSHTRVEVLLDFQNSGGRGPLSLRPVWTTWQVSGQLGHTEKGKRKGKRKRKKKSEEIKC